MALDNEIRRGGVYLDMLIKKTERIIDRRQDGFNTHYHRRRTNRQTYLLYDDTQTLKTGYENIIIQRSGSFSVPKTGTTQYSG